MECHSDLRQEDLEVLADERRLRGIAHLLEHVATCDTGFGVYPSEGEVVVARLEVGSLLLSQLCREPGYDGCHTTVSAIARTAISNTETYRP